MHMTHTAVLLYHLDLYLHSLVYRYAAIVKYKTAFYSFYLPVGIAMYMVSFHRDLCRSVTCRQCLHASTLSTLVSIHLVSARSASMYL